MTRRRVLLLVPARLGHELLPFLCHGRLPENDRGGLVGHARIHCHRVGQKVLGTSQHVNVPLRHAVRAHIARGSA